MNHTPARADLGPSAPRRRGERIVESGLGKHGSERRARIVCHYDALHRQGTLTDAQREAADCFAILDLIASGARWRPDDVSVRKPAWMVGNPSVIALDARAKVREAETALGRFQTEIVRAVAVENIPLSALAAHQRTNPQVVRGWLQAALTRLVEHWESVSVQKLLAER